jgi:heme O synthase-like polyprenyltransferase
MYGLWVFYLAVMNLMRARDAGTLPKSAYVLGLPLLYFGLFLDFLANVTVMTIVMLEVPQEWVVTARLKRHYYQQTWRGTIARWMAGNLLDAFDPTGKHV